MRSRSRCRSRRSTRPACTHATANQSGFTGVLIQLGPFGSSHAGGLWLDLWALAYVALALAVAAWGFSRRDL